MSGEGRRVLITGGSSGIGAATARTLLKGGHFVTVTGRDQARLDAFAQAVDAGEALLTSSGDACDVADVGRAIAGTVERFGGLDVVIASAGFNSFDGLADGDPAKWRDMILVNVLAPAILVQAALPELTKNRGQIVLIGSEAGLMNRPGNMYSVTKWALTAFAENTRLLVAGDGVGVSLIAPGPVDTPFYATRDGGAPSGALDAAAVADAIAWVIDQPVGIDVNTVVLRPSHRS
jgi:NADP-dependent 3-hydroxy acid dehydrogenase YdfG